METNMKELRAVQRMNRAERKGMADNRAMEEQMNRENPLSGRGATPSMGLSQVRGGKKMMMNAGAQGKHLMEHLEALHGSGYAKEFHKGMCGAGFLSDLGIPLVSDVAGMVGLGKKNRKKQESDSENDDMEGGLHTGRYEGEGHCGGAKFSRDTQDFSGHMKGGYLGLAMMALPLISKLLGAGKMTQDAHDQIKDMIDDKMEAHEKKYHSGKMKGGYLGLAMMALPLISKLLGAGKMTQDAHDKLEDMFVKGDKEMKGAGRVVGGMMYPSPKRMPMELQKEAIELKGMGAGDGRKKRAMIVKKVMADRNCSMVEASKYVKEHGLYKKD